MDPERPVVHDIIMIFKNELRDYYPVSEIQGFTELVFEKLLSYTKTDIILNRYTDIPASAFFQIKEIISQLRNYKPIQYILGEAWFYDLKLEVSPDVLIPRQETEELVKWVIDDTGIQSVRLIDIGTGSGCIAIALAKNLPLAKVFATDVSEKAIHLAIKNAKKSEVEIQFIVEDIFTPLLIKSGKYDIIISNPPYVTESEKQVIDKNVLYYEPVDALFVPDEHPLRFYEAISSLALKILNPGGRLYFEINENKADQIEQLLIRSMFSGIEIKKDINGKFRMIRADLQRLY